MLKRHSGLYIASLILASSLFGFDATATAQGKSAGSTAGNKFNSKSKLKANALSPMQNNGSLTTIDNSLSFDAAISCYDRGVGFNGTLNFDGSNNFSLSFSQDTNLDKSLDYTASITNIIGVCQNGIVSGSWGSPEYKKFIVSSGKLSTVATSKNEAFNCFCTNNSCGYGGYDINIHNTLSGAINSAFVSNSVNVAGISDFEPVSKAFTIDFNYPTSCQSNNVPNKYGGSDPRNYYHSQSNPNIQTAVAQTDGKDSNSLYTSVTKHASTSIPISGNSMTVNYKSVKECSIINKPEIQSGTLVMNEINNCTEIPSTCTKRSEHICDQNGANCEQIFFNNTTTAQTKTFCYIASLNENYQICDNLNGLTATNQSTSQMSSFASKHTYRKITYNCGTETQSSDLTQMNSLDTDGKGNFKYKDGTSGTINGLPSNSSSCEVKFCTVAKTIKDTMVYSDSSYESGSSNEMNVRNCVKNISDVFYCPLEAGETQLDACQCDVPTRLANRAIGEVSAIDEMAKDFSCASN